MGSIFLPKFVLADQNVTSFLPAFILKHLNNNILILVKYPYHL